MTFIVQGLMFVQQMQNVIKNINSQMYTTQFEVSRQDKDVRKLSFYKLYPSYKQGYFLVKDYPIITNFSLRIIFERGG